MELFVILSNVWIFLCYSFIIVPNNRNKILLEKYNNRLSYALLTFFVVQGRKAIRTPVSFLQTSPELQDLLSCLDDYNKETNPNNKFSNSIIHTFL